MKAKYLIKTILGSLFFSLYIFLSAGKFDYFQGWLFLIMNLVTSLMNFWATRNDAELMTERSTVGEGSKSWDKIIVGLSALTYVSNITFAGLDSGRYQWSPPFHWSLYVLGVVLMLLGQVIFLAAKKENKYFSSTVRIKWDRGHTVCNTGVYKIVRHPGYLGMAISLMSFPLITGSVWSSITSAIAIILLFIRTYLEDEALKSELPGYIKYTQETKQRLIPKIW
jgi:protein-S-isoprenylcysteine O-methyltransferase Ste14